MLDETDRKIVLELQKDGRSNYRVIAKKLNLSVPTVFRRVQRLLKEDIIRITAIPNPYKVGHPSVAGLCIDVELNKLDTICKKLADFAEIHMVVTTYGRYDVICWVHTVSAEALNKIIRQISRIEGIRDMETIIFAEMTKRTYGWLPNSQKP